MDNVILVLVLGAPLFVYLLWKALRPKQDLATFHKNRLDRLIRSIPSATGFCGALKEQGRMNVEELPPSPTGVYIVRHAGLDTKRKQGLCAYCGRPLRINETECSGCGAPRT